VKAFESVDGILEFAIKREEEAFDFYSGLANSAERGEMQELFRQFADEEKGHKARLLRVKQGGQLQPAEKQVLDLKMSDYLVAEEAGPEMSYQDALILAMKKEKAAFRLYSDLARTAPSADLKTLFLGLAQEEAKHKLRFELEYDSHVLGEN
jgi:rubrerythrin